MNAKTAAKFSALRVEHPATPAVHLLDWARDAVEVDEIAAAIDWNFAHFGYSATGGPFSSGTLGNEGIEIRIYEDDETYDWGDIEPTDAERADLEVIGVGVRIIGDADDLESIWSVGFMGHQTSAQQQALETAVTYGFIKAACAEIAERASMAARDIVTR